MKKFGFNNVKSHNKYRIKYTHICMFIIKINLKNGKCKFIFREQGRLYNDSLYGLFKKVNRSR